MSNDDLTSRMRKQLLKKPPRLHSLLKEPATPIRVIDADPGFPEDTLSKIPFSSARDFLRTRQQTKAFLIKDLIPNSGNVLFRIDPGVDAQMFAVGLGVAVAAGQPFPPYGCSFATKTALVFKSGSLQRIREQVQLCIDRYGVPARNRALELLHLYHPKLEGNQIGYLNSHYEQAELLNSLPDNCKLLIVYDCAGFLATKNERDMQNYGRFSAYLKKLNSQGIATAVFFQSARKAYAGFEDDLIMDAWHNVIDLSPWTGAPRGFGGGFTVSQLKVSEFDTMPTCYHHWHTVIDGKLETGYEYGGPTDSLTMKQVEMAERQISVKQMLARGFPNKTIAAHLKVDPATISRDAAKIKAEERSTSTLAPSEFDEVDSN